MENIAETAVFGYFLHLIVAALQHNFGVMHPYLNYVLVNCHAGLLLEQTPEVGLVQINQLGQVFYREFVRIMHSYEAGYLVYAVIPRYIINFVNENFVQAVQNQHKQGAGLHYIAILLAGPAYRHLPEQLR
jgi:hypothetical protein